MHHASNRVHTFAVVLAAFLLSFARAIISYGTLTDPTGVPSKYQTPSWPRLGLPCFSFADAAYSLSRMDA